MDIEKKFIQYLEKNTGNSFNVFRYNTSYGLEMGRFEQKNVLDIGCGDGLKTLFYAIFGKARYVTGIDSYLGHGSAINNQVKFKNHIDNLGVKNVSIIVDDFLIHNFSEESYDVICASDTLHHLYASEKRALHSEEVFRSYQSILSKIYRLLRPNGFFCLRECQKYSFQRWIPLWRNEIEWSSKQMSTDWIALLKATGFQQISLHYYVPYKLRRSRRLLDNGTANFFLKSVYTIISTKSISQ